MANTFRIKNPKTIVSNVVKDFGLKFTLWVASIYGGVAGCARYFAEFSELPIYQQGNWDGQVYQTMSAVSNIPWTLKGFAGVLSDLIPFAGYEKSGYVLIYTFLGFGSCFILTIIPFNSAEHSSSIPAMLLFMIQVQAAFSDLLTQGKYAQLMKRSKLNGGAIVSFSYLCITIGLLIPSCIVGPMADAMRINYVFAIPMCFTFQPLFFLMAGCLVEDRAEKHRNNKFDTKKFMSNWKIFTLAALTAVGGLGSAFTGLFATPTVQVVYAILASAFLIFISFFCLPTSIAKANAYIFSTFALYPSINGALEYYYTGDSLCVPNGPQFSYSYFRTYVSIVGTVAQFIGIALFELYLANWGYRKVMLIPTIIKSIASLFDILMISRIHLSLGISDEAMYMLGNAIIFKVVNMLDYMPIALLVARLCPKHIEGTVFSLLAGFGNYGETVGRYFGSWAMDFFGIVALAQGPGCNFENLSLLVFVVHFIFPMLTVPLIYICLPNVKLSDNIADHEFEKHEQKKMNKTIFSHTTQ